MDNNKARFIAKSLTILLVVSTIGLYFFSLVLHTETLPGPKLQDEKLTACLMFVFVLYYLLLLGLIKKYAVAAKKLKLTRVVSVLIKVIYVWCAVLLLAVFVVLIHK